MPDLVSSNISSADYNDETGEMSVTFRSGQTYTARVPKETYEALLASPSPGSFYHRNLRNSFSWSPE
jgi:hypothetical protein